MSFYFEFRRPKVGSTLRDFNARGGRAAPLPLAIVMGGVGAVQGNLPQHIFSPRRRTTAGIRNASWALSVLKTAGNKKTKVSNETFVFMVGLSEANSNKFRALLDTKPSATPTAIVSPPTQDGQVVTELKQHPRYLSEEEIQEVIIRYQEGVSANKLAEIYGCHKCTIRSALRRNGITVSHSIADKKLLVEKMILLRNQGYAMKEIAKMVGINYHTVLRYFREHGALPNSGMEDRHQSST